MQSKKSAILPWLGFLAGSGLFVWWAARSDTGRYQVLPPSPEAWKNPISAKLAVDIRTNPSGVLLTGATVYGVRAQDGSFIVTASAAEGVTKKTVDELERLAWYSVQASELTGIEQVKR